jgi:hypothetical protein
MAVAPWRAALANKPQTRRSPAGSFLKEKFVDLDEHTIAPWLRIVCAECGEELVLSPSGHQLCANRLCRDGFDVTLVPQIVTRPCG